MRICILVLLGGLFFSQLLMPASQVSGQETWEQKKAKVFKPLTQEQKQEIQNAIPDAATAKPDQQRKILVFYRCETFIHSSIPWGNYAIQQMGEKTGAFQVDLADTYDVFDAKNLEQYDAILLNSTTSLDFETPDQQAAFMDFIIDGKGLAGIHAASDNFYRAPKCRAIVGGEFGGHPWNAGGTWAFKLDDPEHTLNRPFQGKGFWHTDEIYQYKPGTFAGPKVLRILVSLDMNQQAVKGQIDDGPREVPVSWIREAGQGRVFYTNFGHREDTYTKPAIMQHMLDGIQYALGDLEADATPTAELEAIPEPALAPAR